jgi:hypothetical protein
MVWLCAITLAVLYVGMYSSIVAVERETVVVQGREIFFAPAYPDDGLSQWVFFPVHVIDRNLRRSEWHARPFFGEAVYRGLLEDFGLAASGQP